MSATSFTTEEAKALEEKLFWPRMICLPLGLVTLTMQGVTPLPEQWPQYMFWACLSAFALFCWTSCFHECAHQTLTNQRWVSVLLGRLLGTAMLVPYTVYRESHIRHHAYLNKPTDWELWPYSDPQTSITFRRVFVWLDLFLGVFTAPYVYGRLYFHKNSPLRLPETRWAIFWEYIAIVAFWGTLLGILAWTGNLLEYVKIWFVPYYAAGVLQVGRKLTEHLGMSSYDPMLGTRTVLPQTLLTRITSFMNFDIFIHGPHHRHPRVAHNLLGLKMKEYIQTHPNRDYPVFPTYFRAVVSMVPCMFRRPGVGMNAGAAAPSREKYEGVENFVGDVTKEVLAESDAVVVESVAMPSAKKW